MTTRYAYPVDLHSEGDGGFWVSFPDIPEALTGGADRVEALEMAADCLEEALAAMITDGLAVPEPSPARGRPIVTPGAVIAAKAALYEAMRESGLRKVELARALGCDEAEVRRMLSPRHRTKIGRLEEALRCVGKRLIVTVDAAE